MADKSNEFCKIYNFGNVDTKKVSSDDESIDSKDLHIDPLRLKEELDNNFGNVHARINVCEEMIASHEAIIEYIFTQISFINGLLIEHKLETKDSLKDKLVKFVHETMSQKIDDNFFYGEDVVDEDLSSEAREFLEKLEINKDKNEEDP